MTGTFIDTPFFQWVILPALIFSARVLDVSLDTIRTMLLMRGKKLVPPLLGFFQVLIWLLAIRQIFLNLTNVACYIAFAGGFATGTLVGMLIEEKLAIGTVVIRVITKVDASKLIEHLKNEGYGVTSMQAQGSRGMVHVLFTIIPRSAAPKVLTIIKKFNPRAFYTIENINSVQEGVFPPPRGMKR